MMEDWADKLSSELFGSYDSEGVYDITRETLAVALRKTKADGMREMIDRIDWGSSADRLREEADLVENPAT